MTPKALVIDDDPYIIDAVGDILASLGHQYDHANSVESARQCMEHNEYTYVLLDLEIPVRAGKSFPRIQDGENLLEEIIRGRGTRREPVVIVMTAHGTDGHELAVDVMKKGAVDYVAKPFKSVGRTLDKSIREALAGVGIQPPSPAAGDGAVPATKKSSTSVESRFTGGEMRFVQDRVELCGAIIYQRRNSKRRKALELLAVRDANGFASYSGEDLEMMLELSAGGAAGLIRDIRERITKVLRDELGIECGEEDVILSGGPGFRLSETLRVQSGPGGEVAADQGHSRGNLRLDVPNHVPNVPDPHVPNDSAGSRQAWILQQLMTGRELRARDVAKHFRCSKKTAQRDLTTLKERGKVEFVGAARSGYYRLREPAKASP